jgi:hypothetical protein
MIDDRERITTMILQSRRWLCLLIVGLLLSACAVAPGEAVQFSTQGGLRSGNSVEFLTVNVELTEDGIHPAVISIPAGREVKLIVRNRGMTEHHYQVVGLVPADLWRVTTEAVAPATDDAESMGMTEEEHAHHHEASLGEYLSKSGFQPGNNEVHAFAQGGGGGMDVIFFTAMTKGSYDVRCPLHPDITAKLVVF